MNRIFKLPLIGRFAITTPKIIRDRHGSATRAQAFTGENGFESNLQVVVKDKSGNIRPVKDYLGTRAATKAENALNQDKLFAFLLYQTKLYAIIHDALQRLFYSLVYRDKTALDLGSGLVTNVGVLALANDPFLAGPSGAPISTLKLANYHATGTGATAAAATDIKLQTPSTNGGQTPVAGAQSLVSAANSQKWQTVATLNYTGTEAVTEWGLFCGTIGGALSGTSGTPFTAGSATSGTVTGTPLTASSSTVQGQQQTIFENTGNATPSWGLVTSNTTSVVTVPAWYKVSDGTAGANPANGNAYTIRPVMWDHKVFSAINVVNGDSIQFTYTCTNNSGG